MATEYDLSTSYRNDYELSDWVENVTWERTDDGQLIKLTGLKARFGDFDTAELQSLAAGIGLTNEAAAVVVWQPTPTNSDPLPEGHETFTPKEGDILRRESKGNEGWVIRGFLKSRFGHWMIGCDQEIVNA